MESYGRLHLIYNQLKHLMENKAISSNLIPYSRDFLRGHSPDSKTAETSEKTGPLMTTTSRRSESPKTATFSSWFSSFSEEEFNRLFSLLSGQLEQ